MDKIKPILTKTKELGYEKPTDITDVEHAKAVLAITLK